MSPISSSRVISCSQLNSAFNSQGLRSTIACGVVRYHLNIKSLGNYSRIHPSLITWVWRRGKRGGGATGKRCKNNCWKDKLHETRYLTVMRRFWGGRVVFYACTIQNGIIRIKMYGTWYGTAGMVWRIYCLDYEWAWSSLFFCLISIWRSEHEDWITTKISTEIMILHYLV